MNAPSYPRPSVDEIKGAVCQFFGIPEIAMVSAQRAAWMAKPRQVAMFLSATLTPNSLPQIGRMFGGRDHTTVIHARRVIEGEIERGTDTGKAARALMAELKPRLTMTDAFAEHLAEHGDIELAAVALGQGMGWGEERFAAICERLGPQAS